jgi:SAM-dependent methyltransferase
MNEAADAYQHGYSDWKGWGTESVFATPDTGEADLFRRELREVVRSTTIHDVLEVGYGNGSFLAYCRDRGWNVTGAELLPELREAATHAGFPVVADDAVDTLPEESFDLVAAFDVFEHISPEHSIEFLRTLARRLRPGGHILLRYPNADSWLGNAFQHGDPTHVNAIGTLKLDFYAAQAGLDVVAYRGARRRGFRASAIHGVHRMTAGAYSTVAGALRRAIHFPGLRVVLSTSNVVAVLRRS